ncbi:hypothetical protein RhiirC2_801941 [Rhizophagus irregularis]|uniref:Uncharacterized protein n=1 Tax=Rhizophagus irregularis TaxID=588596 RepID=A0A2N1M1Y2_9GLOM|nr:hypothetical protein RhiirC2_801941 [Rhizophagus irregularis]
MSINSALYASSSAIKRAMEGRIAHLGYQFGTSCLIPGNQKGHERWDCAFGLPIRHFMPQPGNQKVSEWIAEHLRQIDGLQIQHFACISSGNQEMAKQLMWVFRHQNRCNISASRYPIHAILASLESSQCPH